MENGLIILVKNPEKGRPTAGIAKALGEAKARQVHHFLLQHTRDTALSCHCRYFIFYADYLHLNDQFDDQVFTKFLQEGDHPVLRLTNAFDKVFQLGCAKVCMIDTDCYELEPEHLNVAFSALDNHDLVVGPSSNGGCYLVGCKVLPATLFNDSKLEGGSVLNNAMALIEGAGIAYYRLAKLNEIETIGDVLQTNILTHIREGDLEG